MDILVKVHTSRMSGALKHLVAGAPAATTIVFGEIQNFFQDTESVTGEGRYKVQEGAHYKVQDFENFLGRGCLYYRLNGKFSEK